MKRLGKPFRTVPRDLTASDQQYVLCPLHPFMELMPFLEKLVGIIFADVPSSELYVG